MTILDTNVVSEILKPTPAPEVRQWLAQQNAHSLYVTAVTKGEILFGVQLLPKGRRREALHRAVATMFNDDFEGRVLPFGEDAAESYAEILAQRRKIGRPISALDAQIAAIARSHGAAIATRNVRDFLDTSVVVINPFEAAPA